MQRRNAGCGINPLRRTPSHRKGDSKMIRAMLRRSVGLVPWKWRGAIKRLPLIAPVQRWLLMRFLEGREFVHTVDAGPAGGLRYPIKLPDDKGIWTGTYEL